MALEVADIRLEVVALPRLDGEKMVIVPFGPRRDAYWVRNALETSSKFVERTQRQIVESI